EDCAAQEEPPLLECRIVPFAPTAKMSPGPLPHTPTSCCVVPEGSAFQEPLLLPERRIVPPSPPAKLSLGPLPQMANSSSVVENVCGVREVPVLLNCRCRIVPTCVPLFKYEPAANTSVELAFTQPQMPSKESLGTGVWPGQEAPSLFD